MPCRWAIGAIVIMQRSFAADNANVDNVSLLSLQSLTHLDKSAANKFNGAMYMLT